MNQILVTEKVIITPEFKKKKKLYKFNFFLSVFLACTLFSCCIYAEYDRNKSEEISQEILLGLQLEDDTEEVEDNTTISVEEGVLVVQLLDSTSDDSNTVNVSDLLGTNNTSSITELTAEDRNKILYGISTFYRKFRNRISSTIRYFR